MTQCQIEQSDISKRYTHFANFQTGKKKKLYNQYKCSVYMNVKAYHKRLSRQKQDRHARVYTYTLTYTHMPLISNQLL